MHKFAAMRGDPPIPELDVTRPAVAPTNAAAQVQAVRPRSNGFKSGDDPRGNVHSPESSRVEDSVLEPVAAAPEVTCRTCGGCGTVQVEERHDIDQWEQHDIDCPECDGTGAEPAPEFVVGERVMAYDLSNHLDCWAMHDGWRDGWVNPTTRFGYRRPTADELAKHWPEDKPSDGWIEWKGGECPTRSDLRVQARLRSGMDVTQPAILLDWHHRSDSANADIIAYKVLP